jgi:hypothetical protein
MSIQNCIQRTPSEAHGGLGGNPSLPDYARTMYGRFEPSVG